MCADVRVDLGREYAIAAEAQQALPLGESPYRELVEVMPHGAILFEVTGAADADPIYIRSINRAARDMDAIESGEVIGRNVGPDLRNVEALSIVRRVWSTGDSEQATVEVPRRRGGLVWRDCHFIRLPDGLVAAIYRDITERMVAEHGSRVEESRLRRLIDAANDAIFLVATDSEGAPARLAEVNEGACRMLGYDHDEMLAKSPNDIVASPVDTAAARQRARATGHEDAEALVYETVLLSKDGRIVPVEVSTHRTFVDEQPYVVSIARDITERREAIQRVAEANRQLYNIIESLPDATFVLDSERRIVAWNRAMERITGVSKQTVLGRSDVHSEIFYDGNGCLVDLIEAGADPLPDRYRNVKRNGAVTSAEVFAPKLFGGLGAHVAITAAVLRDENDQAYGAIETVRDITQHKDLEERLAYIGTHDSLTGLHSRAFFEMALNGLDQEASAEKGVIMCDLDGLKLVNDSLGHLAGDMMLRAAARALRSSLRESDVVARIGGDEFAVILSDCTADVVQSVCRRIQESVARHNADHPTLPLSISLGFATGVATPGIDLYRLADDAMYREKLHRSNSARSAIVRALMTTLAARDIVTERHSARLERLCASIAEAVGIPKSRTSEIRLLARFHDIGKISVSDSILLKPGALTPDETEEMRQHCRIGHQIALATPDLMPIAEWILYHHERWDGTGYPMGLRGEQIPVECRIVALVDAYDAMTHNRPYRKAMTQRLAVAELERCAGSQFDPHLVETLVTLLRAAKSSRKTQQTDGWAAE